MVDFLNSLVAMDEKKRISQVEELMPEMIRRQDKFSEKMDRLDEGINGLKGGVAGLKDDVGGLKANVAYLKEGQKIQTTRLIQLQKDVTEGQQKLETGIVTLLGGNQKAFAVSFNFISKGCMACFTSETA